MIMEEMWNMRASSMQSSAQPGSSGNNQGFHPEKLRSELVAMVSGSQQQQHVTRPSFTSSLSGRSPYAASLSQFCQMSLPDVGGYSRWPSSQSPSILSQANRGDGGAKTSSAGADASSLGGQGRPDFRSVMTGGRAQENSKTVNGSRAPAAELLMHSSSRFGRGAEELGLEGSWHLPSSQWSTEPARQRQRRNQSSSWTLFPTNSGDSYNAGVSAPLNASGSSIPSWSHSVPPSTSSGGLRVYCISYFGVPVVGQLGLTDAGRLGVTCSCHGHHMSVATFSQHSGLNAANPGEVVYMEGGDTLVQWRKSFFSQYGVRIPEDSVGWQWLDECPPMAAGHSNVKHKAAVPVTRSWQNDVDVSCGGSTPMIKSRATTRQMWDVPLSNGNASTLHATESISNTKFGLLSGPGNHGGMLDSREAMLKSYGHPHKSMASGLEVGNRFHTAVSTHENHYLRAQVNMGATSTSQNMEHHAPMRNEYDGLMNSGGSRYNPLLGQQQNVSGGSVNHVVATRLSESGQESRMREADVSSSFELRLGQPSQQTQAAGTSYSSMATSSVEHPKSHLFEQVMSKVWDGKLQHNLQQFNPANLPKFSGTPDQSRDEEGTHPQAVTERSVENLENGGVENRGEEQGSAANSTAVSQSPRQLMHSDADGVSKLLEDKLMHLESLQNQSEKSSGSEDRLFRRGSSGPELLPHTPSGPSRSVALENGTTLESLSLGALEQLSKTTGQRLLDTAIQSSFTYRAMGLDGPAAAGATQLNGVVPSTSRAEGQCFGQLGAFGRSNIVSGHCASFLELLVRDQLVQNEPELSCGLAMASANGQDPNLRAFQMRDQPGMAFTKQQQHVVQRLVELGRRSEAEQKLECQTLMTNRNGTERRSKEQQGAVMDKQTLGQSQGGPEAEGMANPRLGSSTVDNGVMLSSRLSRGHGEGESTDLQPQPPADLSARGLALDAGSPREGVEVSALSEGDAQCSSLKCRKADPLVKGQAVPRLAGQVCLKEKARLASTFEAARKRDGKQHGMKGPAQVGGADVVVRKCTVDAGQDGMKDVGAEHNVGETPQNEDDVLLDTAGKGTAGGRGGARTAVKMAGKQKRNTKWKWLGSGGADDGVAKDGSPGGSSFGPDAEPQVTSEIARMGSKKFQRAATNASKRGDLVRAYSDEVVPPSKRRKLLVPQRHQEVKATNVTETNLEAAARSLGDGSSKKKTGTTLVIRVPQGVNRQKAKKGMWTKLQQQQPKCGTRDWQADAGKEARAGEEDGRRELEAGKLSASRVARLATKDVMEGCGSGSDGAGVISVTKGIRSPRTPLAGPSPRNGRMVSLSVILNQPSATSPVPRMMENSRAPLQPRLRDDAANISVSRREGTTMHRVSDARVESVSGVTGEQGKEVKSDRGGPSHDTSVAWKATEGIRTRIVQKKVDVQCRKVRNMLELTCKNDDVVHGPGPSSVFEFAEEGEDDDVAAVPSATEKQQATASAGVQTDGPLRQPGAGAGPGRWRTKSCPFPRGERSARPGVPKKRKVEWQRSGDAQTEVAGKRSSVGAVKDASEKEGVFVCRVSQVMSSAGSSISKEKLQQGLCEQGFPVRKQVRTSKAKRSIVAMAEGLQAKDQRGVSAERVGFAENQTLRQLQVQGRGQVKGGITGFGVLKRRSELQLLPGLSAKRPRVALGLKKGKDCHVSEIEGSTDSGEQLKSSRQRGSCLEQKKMVDEDRLAGYSKTHKIKKSQTLDMSGRSSKWRKERGGGGEPGNQLGQGDKYRCDVCGTSSSASYNKLLCCGRCSVKVHQACYGVPKVPKGPWMCRICKFKVSNPICVLCGYGGGAMTRVQKARPLCQALLQTWRELKSGNARASVVEDEDDDDVDDDETLLSATTSILLSRARLAKETKASEGESRDCVDVCRAKSSVCKVCRKESPEPGSSGGYGVRGAAAAAVVASSGREDWRRSNTVGSIVKDAGAKQWAHMVCTLWMPGTRCLNMGTMGVFDVSGVTASRRKALCSLCLRKGGACIQCRVPKCSTPFHVWCAHEKGLLQSEIVQDGSNKVGFFGKCMSHAFGSGVESEDVAKEDVCHSTERSCARTEGYKGRLSLEERATAQHNMHLEGATAVTREQVAEWLRISDRKMNARRVLKSTNPAMKFDNREYLRFKQKKGWRKLTVCKSGIHALGLYTTDFIAEGEVVVEYVGEIVGLRVADKREAEYHSGKRLQYQGACYLFRIDSEQIIDATRKGGIARFVNHSCSPNCVAKVICVDNLKKVIFFAKRDIYAGEEVTYDYKFNYDEVGDKIPCFCGTPECRGTLN